MRRYYLSIGRVMLAVALALSLGCASDPSTESGSSEEIVPRVVMVTHGQAADPFWSVVQNGARKAADDMKVDLEYQAPESFDMIVMSQMIEAAIASRPDGMIVSLPDPGALRPAVSEIAEAGIPLITINSGQEHSSAMGALTHIGQSEYEAGLGAGQKLAGLGVRNALCVNHEVGNAGLDQRCEGFAEAIEKEGGRAVLLAVELADPTESQQRIEAALTADDTVDGLLTLGPVGAQAAVRAVDELGRADRTKIGSIDLSPETLDAIESGRIEFTVDQQQYMQGYLPIVLLALQARNANEIANDMVRTGPGFVTPENVVRLRQLTQDGTR